MYQGNQKRVIRRILTLTASAISRQLRPKAIIIMMWVLLVGIAAGELSGAEEALNPPPGTRVLHFPADRLIGWLSAESGRDLSSPLGLDPGRVALDSDWDFIGLARGDVAVPANRNIQLMINLGPGPDDLSSLAELGPSDLYKLSIQSGTRRSSANRPRLESISHLTGLQILSLYQTGIDSGQMSSLKSLSSLRGLVLSSERSVGSTGLAALKDLSALEYLDCDTGATDTGLKHLGQLSNLRWLRLRMGRIRGPGLVNMANLPRLERLSLWGTTGLTDQHVRYLEGLTRLKSLTIWGGDATLTNVSLASISKLTALEELHLIRIKTDFTDAGVGQLANMTKLRILGASPHDASVLAGMGQLESVGGIALTSKNMKALAGLGNLRSLGLALEAPMSGSAGNPVALLGELKSLEKLYVGSQNVFAKSFGDEELAFLESLSRLKNLSIPVDGLTERGWASIGKLRQLESLSISGGGKDLVTKRGLNHLNQLTHLQKLNLSMSGGLKPITDNTPLNLTALRNLKNIKLVGIRLRRNDWAFLADQDNLEELWLNYCGICPENGLKYIKDLPKLKVLDLQNVNCTQGNGLAVLGGLKKLNSIRMIGHVTDSALRRLPALPSLQMFDVITDVAIQPQTVARLKQIFPAVRNVNIEQPTRQKRPATRSAQERRQTTRTRRRRPRRINR